MEPDEGPTDYSDESQGYDSLIIILAVFKEQRLGPSFEMAEKSDVLLKGRGTR